MASYHGKLLELLSIEDNSGHYLLQVSTSFENNIKLSWEIDEYTAKNLKEITAFDQKYKYRLSFNSYWDVAKEEHVSVLARTYLDQSERIHFSCSQDYVNGLASLRYSQTVTDLDGQYLKPINEISPLPDENIKYINNISFSLASVILVGLVFLICFNYLNPIYLNKMVSNNQVHAQTTNSDEYMSPLIEPGYEPSHSAIYNVAKGTVALTFEAGPSVHSLEIMNVLNEYNVGGTFFFTGSNVKKYPGYAKDLYSNGYSIGNHALNHFYLPDLSYEQQEKELVESNKLIESVIGNKVELFRPPYGAFNEDTEILNNKYQYKMILWNNDPEDWKTHDTDKILNHIKNSNVSGSIIILHETQAVLDALPRIIEYLQELDLQIISL